MVATNVSAVSSTKHSRNAGTSQSVALGQQYRSIVDNFLTSTFTIFGSQPNASFYVMATMWWESKFKVLHKTKGESISPNHAVISRTRGIGKEYWDNPIIQTTLRNSSGDPTILANVTEGLRAQALMATMGMYQVRGIKSSRDMLGTGKYLALAEGMGLMVNPGQSPSSVFVTSDDLGARRSIFFGCLILEQKFNLFRSGNSPALAMQYALGAYLGKAGYADIHNMTPEKRVADINNPNSESSKILLAVGMSVSNQTNTMVSPPQGPAGQTESKTATANNTIGTLPDKVFCVT